MSALSRVLVSARLPAGQTDLTNRTDGVLFCAREGRQLLELCSRTAKIGTLTPGGFVTMPSLSVANAVSLLEMGGPMVWDCFTENQKAVLLARGVVKPV